MGGEGGIGQMKEGGGQAYLTKLTVTGINKTITAHVMGCVGCVSSERY